MRVSSPFTPPPASPKAQQRQGVTYFKESTVHPGLRLWLLDAIGDVRGLQSLAAELNEQLDAKDLATVTKTVIRQAFIAPLETLVEKMDLTGVYGYPHLLITKTHPEKKHEILGLRLYTEQEQHIASAGQTTIWLPKNFTYANAQGTVPLFHRSYELSHVLEQGDAALSKLPATGRTLPERMEHVRKQEAKETAEGVLRDTYGIDVTKDSWSNIARGIPRFFFNFLSAAQ